MKIRDILVQFETMKIRTEIKIVDDENNKIYSFSNSTSSQGSVVFKDLERFDKFTQALLEAEYLSVSWKDKDYYNSCDLVAVVRLAEPQKYFNKFVTWEERGWKEIYEN